MKEYKIIIMITCFFVFILLLMILIFADGSYYAQIEVRDGDNNVYIDRSSIVTISGF